jgi:hypothetical protein
MAAGLLVVGGAGCNKGADPAKGPVKQNGVAIDSRKLQTELASNPSESLRKDMQKFAFGLRYHNYVDALVALDKVAAEPTLTEAQKKLVAEVAEQVKAAANAKEGDAGAAPK